MPPPVALPPPPCSCSETSSRAGGGGSRAPARSWAPAAESTAVHRPRSRGSSSLQRRGEERGWDSLAAAVWAGEGAERRGSRAAFHDRVRLKASSGPSGSPARPPASDEEERHGNRHSAGHSSNAACCKASKRPRTHLSPTTPLGCALYRQIMTILPSQHGQLDPPPSCPPSLPESTPEGPICRALHDQQEHLHHILLKQRREEATLKAVKWRGGDEGAIRGLEEAVIPLRGCR